MDDGKLDKIINELVEHIESALDIDSNYVDCVRTDLLQTVVGLLKEQQKQKKTPQLVDDMQKLGGQLSAFCPSCGRGLYDKNLATKYCYNCGQAVKWDD